MVKWYTRNDWKTKPGLRFDGQVVLLLEPHCATVSIVINVNENMKELPKCWRWAKLHCVAEYTARRFLDVSGYEV